jgi:hypothetical protein
MNAPEKYEKVAAVGNGRREWKDGAQRMGRWLSGIILVSLLPMDDIVCAD